MYILVEWKSYFDSIPPPPTIQIRGRNLRQQLWADFVFRVIVLIEFPLRVFLQSQLGC